ETVPHCNHNFVKQLGEGLKIRLYGQELAQVLSYSKTFLVQTGAWTRIALGLGIGQLWFALFQAMSDIKISVLNIAEILLLRVNRVCIDSRNNQ
ncbi:hypothetical protein J6590_090094, partial [Homalodisca vitripennis]